MSNHFVPMSTKQVWKFDGKTGQEKETVKDRWGKNMM